MKHPTEKICVSLGGMSFDTCMELAAAWPLVEIRLDLINLDPEKIELLAKQCRQWIATCRPGTLTERERTELLAAAIRAGATYVDIEYEAKPAYRRPLMELARKHRCKVIISYHNFLSTPDDFTLGDIIIDSTKMGADRVKLAVMARCPADCVRLITFYEKHNHLLAFAMGEIGKITRISAPFLGADFTFASVDEAHLTAPGQLTASQMEEIYRILG